MQAGNRRVSPWRVCAAGALAHRGMRDGLSKTRQSIGTTATATIRLAASAKVFVHANGANNR